MYGEKRKNNIVGALCAAGSEFLYGLSYVFTKNAAQNAGGFALLAWRFFTAALAMTVCVLLGVIKVDFRGKFPKSLVLVSLCCPCVYFVGETMGISLTSASESGAFLACVPVASLAAAALILREKPLKRQIIGIIITLFGVLLTVFARGFRGSLSVPGYLFLLLGVVSFSLFGVLVSRAGEYSPWEVTYVMVLSGAVFFAAVTLVGAGVKGNIREVLSLPFTDGAFLTAVLYQGIGCSLLAFSMGNRAIAQIGVDKTSTFIGISTVVSILAGGLILKESFSPGQIAGVAIIIAGVYAANIPVKNKKIRR